MKNFKKLFAGVAIVAMLATAVPTTVLGSASYSDELQGAYDYAATNGITTQSSIDTANMYGSLTRVAMAKMMANYAIEVLGQTPDTTKECNFPDVSAALDAQYGNGVTNACQLGLMGVGIDSFNPNGVVTRAQFGTVLSRALYGDEYNVDTNPYYAEHLAALKDAGVMNNISNPDAAEVRGYVMLMMQRADEGTTPAVCETPENVLSCSLNLDTCPAECQTTEVKAGDLTLSSIGVDYTSIPQAGLVSFGSIKLAAGGSDVTVNSIKLKKLGLSDLSTLTKVFFEKDGTRVSSKVSFDTTTKIATVTFTTPLVVKSSETLDVIMSLSGVDASQDIQIQSTDVNSSAANVNGSFTSAVLRTSNYAVVGIKSTPAGSNITNAKVDETKLIDLGELKIQKNGTGSSTRAVTVTALTLNTSGINTADLSYLKDVAIYRDDVKVSTKTIIGTRTISFVLDNEIKTTETAAITYVIKGKITTADRVGDKYSFYVKNVEDVTVLEKDTGFRCTNVPQAGTMPTITIAGGDLRFTENTVSALTVVPGAKNVVFYDGSLNSLEAITLDTLQGVAYTVNNGSGLNQVLDNLYLKIGSSVITVDDLTAGTLKFEGQVTVNGTVPFMIYGDVKTDAPTTYVQFTSSIGSSFFATKEDANGDAVSGIGSIGGRKATITAADLTMTNSSASTKNIQRGDRGVLLASLEFGTTSDITSRLYSFKADVSGTGRQAFDGAEVTVYDEAGTALVSDVVDTGSSWKGTFVLPNYLPISKGHPVKLTVKLNQVPNTVNVADKYLQLTFDKDDVNAKDIINSNTLTPTADATSTLLKSVLGGSASEVSQSFTNSLVKYGSLAVIGNVKVKAVDADIVFKDAYFTLAGLSNANMNKVSSAELFEDGVSIASLTKNGNILYATNLNKTIAVGTTKTYEVRATITAVNTNADVLPSFSTTLSTGTFESTYGNTLTPLTGKTASATIAVVNEIPTVTAVTATTKGNNVIYKITLASTKEITLSGVKLSVYGVNLSGATAQLNALEGQLASDDLGTTLYKTGLVASNVLTLGNLSNSLVSVQGTRDIYVILKNAVLMESNGNTPVQVRVTLTDMSYNDVFEDATKTANNSMLNSYQALMAGALNLTTITAIQ